MKISVIGTGYLGATHAAAMAEIGHEVVGVDVDELKVERLSAGVVPFYEPGLPELLARHVQSGKLRFTTSVESAVTSADVHFVCVGTPQKPGEFAADLKYVDAAFLEVGQHLKPGDTVVGKSTVPVGTALRLSRELEAVGAHLVWNRSSFARASLSKTRSIPIGSCSAPTPSAAWSFCVRRTRRSWPRACLLSRPIRYG